jgi:hypothetical protein
MEHHHRWMLAGLLLCLVVAAAFTSAPGYTGLLGILFALLMVGCCLLPALFVIGGRGKGSGHSCHGGGGDGKEAHNPGGEHSHGAGPAKKER